MKKQVNKKNSIINEMYKEVPEAIKITYGKFYFYSLLYFVFFAIIYPFFMIGNTNEFVNGMCFGFLVVFYVFVLIDTRKKAKTYISLYYYLIILFVVLAMSFSIVKYFI